MEKTKQIDFTNEKHELFVEVIWSYVDKIRRFTNTFLSFIPFLTRKAYIRKITTSR